MLFQNQSSSSKEYGMIVQHNNISRHFQMKSQVCYLLESVFILCTTKLTRLLLQIHANTINH